MDPLRVGDVLYGYCGGFFGRDSYGDKRVEAIGADWVIVRNQVTGFVEAATNVSPSDFSDNWRVPETEEEHD